MKQNSQKSEIDHIKELVIYYGTNGYFYKDHSDLIGFFSRGGNVDWYRKDGDRCPIKIERGTPEQEFNRVHNARYLKIRNRNTGEMLK